MASHERTFRADVEGLRAVAVGLVVLSHAGVSAVAGGYIGVDVFFVLSGFLITGLLLRERVTTGSTSVAGFYARRARRILPAASLVIIVTVVASYEYLGFLRGDVIAQDGKWAALFAVNLHLAHEGTQYLNIGAPPSPLQHYWSLAVEEQFYLVWPIVFLAVARIAPRVGLAAKLAGVLVVVISASFLWSVVQTGTNPTWAFFSPLTRAWELALGALLAVSVPQLRRLPGGLGPWLSWGGLAGIFAAAFAFDNATAFPGSAAALPVVATAMVVAGGTIAPLKGAERVLGLFPFQMLGRWSYSLYLWHWPVLIIGEQRVGHALSLTEKLGLVALALVLAVATHYAVENPIRYARPLARNAWSSVAVGACLVVATFGLIAWQVGANSPPGAPVRVEQAAAPDAPVFFAGGAPEVPEPVRDPIAEVLELVAAAPTIAALPSDLAPNLKDAAWDFGWITEWADGCLLDPEEMETQHPCVFGDPGGARTVVLLGDSHAGQWLEALDDIGKRQQWRVVLIGKAGCPAAAVSFRTAYRSGSQKLVGPGPDCASWLDDGIARINEMEPELVVLASCNGCEYMVDESGELLERAFWATGLRETLSRISTPNRVILGDIPRWRGPLDCLALHTNNVQACSKPVGPVTEATYNDAERGVAEEAGVPFIDVTPWFCDSVCSPVIGNMVVYTNEYHVTSTYARYLGNALEAVLVPLFEQE